MASLLEAIAKRGTAQTYARELLPALGRADDRRPDGQRPDDQAPIESRTALVEPLSERELDVMRLLATDLTGPEIASELVVSLNTIRTHTKSIYAKLGVSSRRAAVRRAEDLHLLSRTRDH